VQERRGLGGDPRGHSHPPRRPVKVWSASRAVRKALVVGAYDEFLRKGREKLCVGVSEPVRVVLESDGTQVEDGEYFQTLPENTIFILLRPGEAWAPAGEDIVSQVVSTIPKIVCETLAALGLQEEIPSWKIMDNKGKITVVLHWEKEHPLGQPPALQVGNSSSVSRVTSRQSSTCSTIAGGPRLLGVHSRGPSRGAGSSVSSTPCLSRDNSRNSNSGQQQNSMVQTSFDSGYGMHSYLGKDGKREALIGEVYKKGSAAAAQAPTVTVINADSEPVGTKAAEARAGATQGAFLGSRPIISGAPSPRQLSRQGSSVESSAVHTHTVECSGGAHRLHQPALAPHSRGSPTSNECDFHCCSLHAGTATHKTVATSPIQAEDGKRSLPKGAHVRFDVENLGASNSKCNFATKHHLNIYNFTGITKINFKSTHSFA